MPFTGFTLQEMPTIVKKSPPHLKALATSRACLADEIARLQNHLESVASKLREHELRLSELDRQIRRIESRIDPTQIAPIRACIPYRTTPHGQLRATVLAILKAAGEPITVTEIAAEIQSRYQIEFLGEAEYRKWRNNCVGSQLRDFLRDGLVERTLGPRLTGAGGRWRLKSGAVPSPDHLREQAETRGAGTQEYDAFHE